MVPVNVKLSDLQTKDSDLKGHRIDIFLSHAPPMGILAGERFGSEAVLQDVQNVQPRYHVFGHAHDSFGRQKSKATLFQNGAQSVEFEEVVELREPLVLEI